MPNWRALMSSLFIEYGARFIVENKNLKDIGIYIGLLRRLEELSVDVNNGITAPSKFVDNQYEEDILQEKLEKSPAVLLQPEPVSGSKKDEDELNQKRNNLKFWEFRRANQKKNNSQRQQWDTVFSKIFYCSVGGSIL